MSAPVRPERPTAPSARRTLWALVCALVLALAGVAVPAQAADEVAPISGRVVVPAGADPTQLAVEAFPDSYGNARGRTTVAGDGTFTVTPTVSSTTGYRLRLVDPSGELATGWYEAGGSVTIVDAAATLVHAGTSGVVVHEVAGAAIAGRVELPESYEWDPENAPWLSLRHPDHSFLSYSLPSTEVAEDGSFALRGLAPAPGYVLSFNDGSRQLAAGRYRADGSVANSPAAPITAPVSDLVLRPSPAGVITGRLELPADHLGEPGGYVVAEPVNTDLWYVVGGHYEEGDESAFEIDGLVVGEKYTLRFESYTELTGGYYGPDGTIVADRADATALVVPQADLVVRPSLKPMVRGELRYPPAAVAKPFGEPSVSLYARTGEDGPEFRDRWKSAGFSELRRWDSRTFRFTGIEEDQEYILSFGVYMYSKTVGTGFWAGNDKPLVQDEKDAKVFRGSQLDLVIPFLQQNTAQPKIWGSTNVGGTLNVSKGTWEDSASQVSFQWLRHGTPIAGATSSKYKVTRADLGYNLSVRVTARAEFANPTTVRSTIVKVPKATPKVSLTVPKSVTAGGAVQVGVRVVTTGVSDVPSGKVRVSYAGGSTTVNLGYAHKGRVTVRLVGLKRGTHTVTAVYTPSTVMAKYVTTGRSSGARLAVR